MADRPNIVTKLLREPLIGFAVAALAIFGLNHVLSEPELETITLAPDSVELMIGNREAMLGRALTETERERMIANLADQEVLVREAVKLGLYLHDPKTRKRLIDQMHFLMAKQAPEPTAEDLERLRAERPDRYLFPRTVSFEHVFFETDADGARALAAQLRAGAALPDDVGDRFWLGRALENYTDGQLLMLLGPGFVAQIYQQPTGVWSDPIESARGWHVLRVTRFNDPSALPAQELARRLQEDWETDYRRRTYDVQMEEMRQRYRIERPAASAPSADATTGADRGVEVAGQ